MRLLGGHVPVFFVLVAVAMLPLPRRVGPIYRLVLLVLLFVVVSTTLARDAPSGLVFLAVVLPFVAAWVLYGFAFMRRFDRRLAERAQAQGLTTAGSSTALAEQGWHWLGMLDRRNVSVDRLVADETRAMFTLVRGWTGATRRTRRRPPLLVGAFVGAGVIVPLPRAFPAATVALPQAHGLRGFMRWFVGLRLPEVAVTDPRVGALWSFASADPEDAAATIAEDAPLRNALVEVAEHDLARTLPPAGVRFSGPRLGTRPTYLQLVIELRGSQAAFIAGPRLVGRDLLADLEATAERFVQTLGAG